MAFNEESSASGHDEPWIQWFCGLKGHEMFCEVERSYIEDGFNLYGLRAFVSNFSDCVDLILDRIGADESDDSHLTQSACALYGLIHARYVITAHGLDAMYNKYAGKEFGTCPLLQCNGQPVLPVGLHDEMGVDSVKIFCPKCQCVYHPPPTRGRSNNGALNYTHGNGALDGAAFGTTFPHLFLMTFNNLVPDTLSPESAYVPRVFGFRVHPIARQRNGGGGSASLLPSASANSRRTNVASTGNDGNVANGSTNAIEAEPVNATASNENTARSLDQTNHEDKTASTSAVASLQTKQTENKKSAGGSAKNSKKASSNSDGKKVKPDLGTASKRKSKAGEENKSSGDGDTGQSKNKRQRRPNNISS